MSVLITGGTGYIGSHTAVVLSQLGHQVVLYDNLSNSSDTVHEKLEQLTGQRIPFVKGDVRDTELVKATLADHRIDAVMHFAGLKAVSESVEKPVEYYANNVQGIISLLQAMQSAHVKTLVFISSATVYGEPEYLPLDESHPTSATNPYGRSMLHIEEMLNDVAASAPGWRIACLRHFNLVGAHASGLIGENPNGVPKPHALYRSRGRRAANRIERLRWRLPYGRWYGREVLHPCDVPGRGARSRIEFPVSIHRLACHQPGYREGFQRTRDGPGV
jgi:UDP-glucose 4-epimerase